VIVQVTSSDLEFNVSNNIAQTSCSITSSYDLSLRINHFPDPVISGNALSFNVSWYNAGPSDISSVVIEISFISSMFTPGNVNSLFFF
jgi:hypothetical protein